MGNFTPLERDVNVTYAMTSNDLDLYGERKKEEGRRLALIELQRESEKAKPRVARKSAMEQLGISETTIIQWAKRGIIRVVHHGHRTMYFQEDIDRILLEGTSK